MKMTKFSFAVLLLSSALFMFSCKKNSDTTDSDTSGASDNALAENTSNDVVAIGSQAADGGSLSTARLGDGSDNVLSCASVVRDTGAKTVTVTFNGNTCFDGRTRSGTIIFNFSQSAANSVHYRDPGFKCAVSFNNYTVDGNQITNTSTHTIENITNGDNPVGYNPATTNETWSITANMSIVKANNAGTVSWTCSRTKTLLNTSTTCRDSDFVNFPANDNVPIDWPNARVGIMGNASGTRANGETFTVTINTQLVRDFGSCSIGLKHPFILGTLQYAPSGKPIRYVDYGAPNNGQCDLIAAVTINGHTYDITLP
jgi:hypothetical protein